MVGGTEATTEYHDPTRKKVQYRHVPNRPNRTGSPYFSDFWGPKNGPKMKNFYKSSLDAKYGRGDRGNHGVS